MSAVVGFTVSVVVRGEAASMARRVAAAVCQSRMHLAEAQVGEAVMECTFRMRQHGAVLDDGTMHDVLRRMSAYETSDVRFVTVTESPTEMLPDVDTAA